jgi:hypothetical protein
VAVVVVVTAWFACAVAVKAGPLSYEASGPVQHAREVFSMPQLEAIPVSADIAVPAVPAVFMKPATVVKKHAKHPRHGKHGKHLKSSSTRPSSLNVVHPVSPGTLTHPSAVSTHAPAKSHPLHVGVTIPSSPGKGAGTTTPGVLVVTSTGTKPTVPGGTSTTTTVTTGATGPVGTGADPGTGAASTPLPPVDGTSPGSPFPTPTSPPSSGVAGTTTGPSTTSAPR